MSISARPLIVQRIKAANLGFSVIRGTSNLQSVLRSGWASPACFVWRSRVIANPESMNAGRVFQAVRVHYTIAIAIKTEKDDGTIEDSAELLSNGVMNALLGWIPTAGGHGFLYAGGDEEIYLQRNLLLWLDTYEIIDYIEA